MNETLRTIFDGAFSGLTMGIWGHHCNTQKMEEYNRLHDERRKKLLDSIYIEKDKYATKKTSC